MSFEVSEPTVVQRAALALHALPESDRAWLLQALTPAQRGSVEPLLLELQELRLPADPDLLQGLAERTPDMPVTDWDRLRSLDDHAVRRLAALLAAEPARITSIVLGGGKWSWEGALLGALPSGLVLEARSLMTSAPGPVALQRAVAAELLLRLKAGERDSRSASRWVRLLRALSPRRGA